MRHFCGFLLPRRPPEGKAPGLTPTPQAFTPHRDVPARPAVPNMVILAGGRCGVNVTHRGRRFTTGLKAGALRRFLVAAQPGAAGRARNFRSSHSSPICLADLAARLAGTWRWHDAALGAGMSQEHDK